MDRESFPSDASVSDKVDPKEHESDDLFDSDSDPEFNLREFKKRNLHNLSDSEEEALGIEIARKKRKEKQVTKKRKIEKKPASPAPLATVSHVEEEEEGSDKDEEVGGEHDFGGDYSKLKKICIDQIAKFCETSKGERKNAFKKSLQALVEQETPDQINQKYDERIQQLKIKIKETELEKKEKIEKCKSFWELQIDSLPKSGKSTARKRLSSLPGTK